MTKDLSHLDALLSRLTRENGRLQDAEVALKIARTARQTAKAQNEINFRKHEIMMCQREVDAEYKFLGIPVLTLEEMMMSDDDLLAELGV